MNELDEKVAEALGWVKEPVDMMIYWFDPKTNMYMYPIDIDNGNDYFTPSTNWQQAGELLEKYGISLDFRNDFCKGAQWQARYNHLTDCRVFSITPQEAICKAVIALKESDNGQ